MSIEASDWLKEYQAEQKRRREGLPATARALREKLQAIGATTVTAEYSGSNDSGQIDGIDFEPKELKIEPALESEISDFLYEVLGARHAGWENNDGGCGAFRWDLVADKFEHDHTTYYTESNTTGHEGFDS